MLCYNKSNKGWNVQAKEVAINQTWAQCTVSTNIIMYHSFNFTNVSESLEVTNFILLWLEHTQSSHRLFDYCIVISYLIVWCHASSILLAAVHMGYATSFS